MFRFFCTALLIGLLNEIFLKAEVSEIGHRVFFFLFFFPRIAKEMARQRTRREETPARGLG